MCADIVPALAQDAEPPPAYGVAGAAQVQARVVGIDAASNSVTLRGPFGRAVEVAVNPQIANVSKLKLGDTVNISSIAMRC